MGCIPLKKKSEVSMDETELMELRLHCRQLGAEVEKQDFLLEERRHEVSFWKSKFWASKREELNEARRHKIITRGT